MLLLFLTVAPLQCATDGVNEPYLVPGPPLGTSTLSSSGTDRTPLEMSAGLRETSRSQQSLLPKKNQKLLICVTNASAVHVDAPNPQKTIRKQTFARVDSPWRSPTAKPRCGWWLSTWLGSSRVFSMTEPAWSARSNSSRSSRRRRPARAFP